MSHAKGSAIETYWGIKKKEENLATLTDFIAAQVFHAEQ